LLGVFSDHVVMDVMEMDDDKVEEITAAARNGEWLCAVCGDTASGNFFGATVCLPCKVGSS
jgi:hypothetical protein